MVGAGSRLRFRQDRRDFLIDQTAQASRIPPEISRELAGGNRLAIVLEAKDSIETGDVQQVFDFLVARLDTLTGVQRLDAQPGTDREHFLREHFPPRITLYLEPGALVTAGRRLTRAAMDSALSTPSDSPLQDALATLGGAPQDPLGLLKLASQPMRAWLGVSRLRSNHGFVTLAGARKFFLVVEVAPTHDDVLPASRLVASIEQTLEDARNDPDLGALLTGRRLYSTGLIGVSVAVTMRRDGARIAAASGVVVIVLLGLFFRRIVAPVVIMLTLAVGLLTTAAAAAAGYGSVSLLAWMFTGLLVGLGDDYAVHICSQYWVHGRADAGREAALTAALTRPGRGIIISAFTSAAGFLSLTLIPYPYTRQVGLLTALGLMAILLSSFTVLPLLLSFVPPSAMKVRQPPGSALLRMVNPGASLKGAVPWMLLIGAGIAVLPTLRFDAHPWRSLLRGDPEAARLEGLSREAGLTFAPILILSTGATTGEALRRDREAIRRLQPVALRAGVAAIQSLAQWFPDPEHQRSNLAYLRAHPDLFSPSRIRGDFTAAVAQLETPDPYLMEEYLPRILATLESPPQELTVADLRSLGLGEEVDRHLVRRGDTHIAISYVYLRQLPWEEGVVSRFRDAIADAGLNGLSGVSVTGLRYSDSRDIARAVGGAALVAVAAVLVILWYEFRRLSLVALCLAPLLCGLSATFLAMRLLGIEFNLVTAAIAPILIGIGVDDGIHMVERLRAGQEVSVALREAGSSEIVTTLTTVGAFSCLALASIPGVRQAGLLGAVGLVTCLLASLHLVPLGWRLISSR
jgi:uncharacterized protein